MIEWNSDYLTGIDEIDLQHQYFTMLINRIETKISSIALDEGHSPLLNELIYEAGYPDLDMHKRLHSDLIEQLNNEIQMLESDLVEPTHIIDMLVSWFRVHTLEEDGKYASFIVRQGTPGSAH